jgi:hypothetical protein
MSALDINGGSFESIAELPAQLGPGSELQFLFDNGDSVWYADGIAAKDLAESRFRKAASLRVSVDVAFPAASLAASGGTPQSEAVLQSFAAPLQVQVADAYGHAVAGVSVGFTAPTSGASAVLSANTAVTDANGIASITATANASAGSYGVVARVNGVGTSASFTLTNTPGSPAAISVTGGTPQSAVVHLVFVAPLAVHVTDANGNAVANATVAFNAPVSGASAVASSTSATTDADGNASVTASANAVAGSYTLVASVQGLASQANFALTNIAGPVAAVAVSGGSPQSAIVNHAFAAPLAVHAVDADGNAVAGASVSFAVPTSGTSATLSATTAMTDANGDASVTATANATVGSYAVTAGIEGVADAASFALTNTTDPATDVIFRDGFESSTP